MTLDSYSLAYLSQKAIKSYNYLRDLTFRFYKNLKMAENNSSKQGERRTMYNQPDFYQQMQKSKREAYGKFLGNACTYTFDAFAVATVFTLVFGWPAVRARGVEAIYKSPLMPLWAGIAGGVALSQCADSFNKLRDLERKIFSDDADNDKKMKELVERVEILNLTIIEAKQVSNDSDQQASMIAIPDTLKQAYESLTSKTKQL